MTSLNYIIKKTKFILDRYPPLKAFAISLVIFIFIPCMIFLGYIAVTGSIVAGVATFVGGIVQGSFFLFGLFLFFWWFAFALLSSGIASFWFSLGYFGLKTANKLYKS